MPRSSCFMRLAALVIFTATATFAQVNTATVYGTVSDQCGGIVPNARVQAKNSLTNIVTSTMSNGRGDFTFNFLPVGDYNFSVAAAGFQGQVRNDVDLSAG